MKLYKTANAILVEKNVQYYTLTCNDWQSFINDDSLFQKVERMIEGMPVMESANTETVLAPMGDRRELWACGVTYLRSKIGRQEESQLSGGAVFGPNSGKKGS